MVDNYIAHRLARHELAESSAAVIATVLHHWIARAGESPKEWTAGDVARWVHDPNIRPSTAKSRLTKLRPFVRWLISEGELEHDITVDVGRIRVPKTTPRDLTAEQVERLIAVCPDERARLIVVMMVQLGLRCGDLARARVEDVDPHRRTLHVRAKGGGGHPTHWVPITDEAWRVIEPVIRGRSAGSIVRSLHTGAALQPATVSRMVRGWLRSAGLKAMPYDGVSAHALRHTCAQHMLDQGADLREVQFALGHSTIRSTETYTRREPPGLREAMEGRRYADAA